MVFSSATFLFAFLPITLILYYLPLFENRYSELTKKNVVLCLMSLLFYAWGEHVYIVLMLISIIFNYNVAIDIEESVGNYRRKKLFLLISVVFNVFVLGFFKYSGFLTESINGVFGLSLQQRNLPLPVGISFYTFQILSYVIDVYKGDVYAQRKLLPFATYITMFPQLIAGPIVQYYNIEKQLTERNFTRDQFAAGIMIFIKGLGKKVLFANTVGAVYTQILAMNIPSLSVVSAWIGIICYTLQIYFDFSGYSDMAIGLGKMFGFEFLQNFNFPYIANSLTDFWRRWHISLSSWFRDYIYIPLGGNRKGTARTIFNLLVVWTLTGMWHGAAWNFVAWGVYYGVLLIAEKYVFGKLIEKLPSVIRHTVTLVLVMIGWVLFSNENMTDAVIYLRSMFALSGNSFIDETAGFLISNNGFSIILMSFSALGLFAKFPRPKNFRFNITFMSLGYLCIFALCVAYLISETYNPFLYFRF